MLTNDQAESASELLLADGRARQAQATQRIANKHRPFSTWLRFTVTAATGLLVGGLLGEQQAGAFFPWCLVGLLAGVAYGFLLGHMRRRHEA